MLIIARIDFISEICLIHSHAANGLLESRSRTKSHCPALHKHARTHTHANTHTDLPISLISTVPAARVPSVQDTDLKGHSVSPLSPEKCQLANPARLSPDCLSEQSAPVWLLKTSKKKKIIQTEVNTSLTKLLFMSRLSMWVLSLWNCVTQQTELKQMESTVNPALLLSHFAYWSRRLGNAQKALLFDFDSRSSLLANNMHFRGEGEGTQGTRTVRRGRGGFWMFWWWPWHD